jgi:hypothetical protein
MLAVGAMTAASGVIILRTRVFPRWLAWLGIVIAVVCIPTIPPLTFITAILLALWTLWISALMIRTASQPTPTG